MTDKIKVIISNDQKDIKIPTGVRMLVRRVWMGWRVHV